MKQKREKYINFAVCAIVFLFMLFLTAITPYLSDDWHFKFVWKDFYPVENDRLLNSLGGLIESAKNYYKYSGGRVLCHSVLFIFDNANKWIFNIVNSLMLVLFALLIYKLIKRGEKRSTPWLLPLIFFYIFMFIEDFGDDILWVSGAVNYLWPAVLLLSAAKLVDTDLEKMPAGKYIFTCFAVFLSSLTNEVTGGMLAILIFLTLIERKSKFSAKYIPLYLLIALGIAAVAAAPGNFIRSNKIEEHSISFIQSLRSYYENYFDWCWAFIWLNIFSALYFYNNAKKGLIKEITEQKYFAAGTAGILVLFVTKFTFTRPLIFGLSFIIISAARNFYRLKKDISEKISRSQPELAMKLLKCFFYANIYIGVLIVVRFAEELEDLIVYTLLTLFIELLTFVIIKVISTEKGKDEFAQTAQKNKAAFSKAAKFVPSAALALVSVLLTADIAFQAYLYNGDVKAFNGYMEEAYICAEEQGDIRTLEHLEYENDIVGGIMVMRIFGDLSRYSPYIMYTDSCNYYTFSWIYKYSTYTGYTGRGY